ncbi:MAG: response regulator [bacterium]|nr:response regulator [bacterium]
MNKEIKDTTIFLIDDDDFLLEMYALKFRNSGYKVEIAKDADEALKKLREGLKADVILLDIVMPKIDGFEFLKIAKKENLVGNTEKVIILSNLGQNDDIQKGLKLGVADYIVKASLTPSEVVEKVKSLLES